MTLTVTCPNCDKTINADEKFAGKTAACPGCGHTLEIPEVQQAPPAQPPSRKVPPPRQKSAPIPDIAESPRKKTTKSTKSSRWLKITAILLVVAFIVAASIWLLWPFDAVESFNQFARKKYENYQQESVEPTVIDLSISVKESNRSWCKVWREPNTASFEIDVEKTISEISPYMGTLKFSEKIFFSERFESKEAAQACEEYAFQKKRSMTASYKFIKSKDTWEPTEHVNDLAESSIEYPFEDEKLLAQDAKLPNGNTESQELDLQTAKEEVKIKVNSLQKKISIEQKEFNLANRGLEKALTRSEQLQAIVQSAEQRFGAMPAFEQRRTLQVAKKASEGQDLTQRQTELLSRFPGLYGGRVVPRYTPLGGQIAAQNKRRAEAGGFNQLLEMSDIMDEISVEEQEIAAWKEKADGHREVIIELTDEIESTLDTLEK